MFCCCAFVAKGCWWQWKAARALALPGMAGPGAPRSHMCCKNAPWMPVISLFPLLFGVFNNNFKVFVFIGFVIIYFYNIFALIKGSRVLLMLFLLLSLLLTASRSSPKDRGAIAVTKWLRSLKKEENLNLRCNLTWVRYKPNQTANLSFRWSIATRNLKISRNMRSLTYVRDDKKF